MKRVMLWTATIVLVLALPVLQAQDDSRVKTTQLTDKLFLLWVDEGSYSTNALAFVGDDGVLLVDTQAKDVSEEFRKAVEALGKGIPKYIINTHRHVEHIGGNAIFGEAPIVIAHERLPSKLQGGSYIFNEYPPATYPDITFADSLKLEFNGETIRLFFIGGSHDDNEIAVHFVDQKFVHLSSIVNGFCFPSIDSDGDLFAFPSVVSRARDLLPHDVTVISGHKGPTGELTGKWEDLDKYIDMQVATVAAVQAGLKAGKTVEQMQADSILAPWATYGRSYVSQNGWINTIATWTENKDKPKKKKIHVPLYHAFKEKGVDTAITLYVELKNNDEYEVGDFDLVTIGSKLLENGYNDEAIRFLELNLTENPESEYLYYHHYALADAYKKISKKELALEHCQKSIDLRADWKPSQTLMEEITAM